VIFSDEKNSFVSRTIPYEAPYEASRCSFPRGSFASRAGKRIVVLFLTGASFFPCFVSTQSFVITTIDRSLPFLQTRVLKGPRKLCAIRELLRAKLPSQNWLRWVWKVSVALLNLHTVMCELQWGTLCDEIGRFCIEGCETERYRYLSKQIARGILKL